MRSWQAGRALQAGQATLVLQAFRRR